VQTKATGNRPETSTKGAGQKRMKEDTTDAGVMQSVPGRDAARPKSKDHGVKTSGKKEEQKGTAISKSSTDSIYIGGPPKAKKQKTDSGI